MHLHIHNKKPVVFTILLLLVIFLVSLFIKFGQNVPPEKTFLQAAGYFQKWQLNKSEKLLSSTFRDSRINSKTANLYLQILISQGELYKAQKFIWKYFPNNNLEKPRINLKKGLTYYYLGKIDSSQIVVEAALTAGLKTKNPSIISQANNILGRIKFYKAEYDSASYYQNTALKYASKSNLENEKADALRQLGVLYWYKGKLDSALSNYYKPALKIYRQVNNKIGEATTLSNIGLLYYNWKDWEQNFAYNLKALNIRKSIDDRIGLSDSYYFLSFLPLFNKTMKSTQYKLLKKSFDLSKKIGYAWGAEVAGRSIEFFLATNLNEGIDIESSDTINYASGEGKLFSLIRKIFAPKNKDNIDSLNNIYKTFTAYSDSLNYEVFKFSSLLGYIAILIKQNKLLDAEKIANQALKLTYSLNKRKYSYHSVNQFLAEIYFKKGNPLKALKILNNLTQYYDSLYVSKLNNNPSVLGYESAISETYESRSSAYALLLDTLFKLKENDLFFEAIESQRRLNLWQTPKNIKSGSGYSHTDFTELLLQYIDSKNVKKQEEQLKNEFGEMVNSKIQQQRTILGISKGMSANLPVKLKIFQESLGENSAFLEYAFGGNFLYCMIITQDRVFIKRLNINEKNLNQLIAFFRNTILRGKWKRDDKIWEMPSLNLYNHLIKPLNKFGVFEKSKNIIISPIRSLNLLPFSALIKSINNNSINYLIQNNVLSFTNSAEEYYWNHIRDDSVVNSLFALAPHSNDIFYSKDEISEIPRSIFKQQKILTGDDANLKNFLNYLFDYDVIHFAGHTLVNIANPFYSELNFADASLELFQILKFRIPAKLIILSGCGSGIGMGTVTDSPTEEDLISFPRAWITAGAKSVIATQWLVEDKSASLLMKRFYQNLRIDKIGKSINFSADLSNAQMSIAKSPQTKQYSHPFYWAEFYLTN